MQESPLELGKGPILPLLIQMSWPSMVGMFAMAIYNIVDAFWVARLSHQALAALTICYPIQAIILSIGIGTGVGAGSFTSRMFGAGEIQQARQAAGQTIMVSLCLGILLILLVHFHAEAILLFFGANEETLAPAIQYLQILVYGAPFLFILFIANNLLRAEGRPRLSMCIVLAWAVAGSTLAPFLIFGWGIFPEMGLRGSAVAAVSAQVLLGSFSLYLLRHKNSRYRLSWPQLYPDLAITIATYRNGLPSIVMNMIMSIILILYNHVLSGYGTSALAIMGLCFRINSLVMMVIFAIGHGVLPIVSYNEGAQLPHRSRETVRMAVRIALIFAGISSVLLVLFANPILSIFIADPLLLTQTVVALRIYVSMLIFSGPIFVWINTFIGLGRGPTAMMLLMVRDVLIVAPLLFLLPPWLGLNGVWMTQPIGNAIAFLIIWFWIKMIFETKTIRAET